MMSKGRGQVVTSTERLGCTEEGLRVADSYCKTQLWCQ